MNSVLVLSSRPRFGQGIENLLREDVRFKIAGVETDRDKAIQHV